MTIKNAEFSLIEYTIIFSVSLNAKCVVPEKIHTFPMKGYWKFQGEEGVKEEGVKRLCILRKV